MAEVITRLLVASRSEFGVHFLNHGPVTTRKTFLLHCVGLNSSVVPTYFLHPLAL